jgi:serine/threonine-protein kinase
MRDPSLVSTEAQLAPGTRLAGFRIDAPIGRGGMGVVYRATQLSLERTVALKVVAPEFASSPAFRERFIRESKVAASLDNAHVLPVYAAGEDGGHLYLAMRYVHGADLGSLLRAQEALSAERVIALLAQVAEALDAAHARGLVHRDVKPANVLVEPRGDREHAFLADFGLTKSSDSASRLTMTGQVLGTVDYTSPEQIRGEPVDARSDVYSLGCLAFEALTGTVPFPHADEVAKLWAHLHEAPPSATSLRPGLPAALDDVLQRALAKEPARRFASAGALARAARSALECPGNPAARTFGRRGSRVARGLRRRGRHIVAGAIIVAAVAVAIAAAVPLVDGGTSDAGSAGGGFGAPIRLAQSPDRIAFLGEHLWVLQVELGRMARIDPRSRKVDYFTAPIDLAGGDFPDVASGFGGLWVAHGIPSVGGVDRIEPRDAEGVAHVPLPSARAVTAGRRWVWAAAPGDASAPGVVIRIDPRSNRRTGSPIVIGGVPVAMVERAGALWIVDRARNRVLRVDANTARTTARIDVGRGPERLALTDDAVWVANLTDRTLSRIDPQTNEVVGAAISLGKEIEDIAATEDALWVAGSDATLTRLDPTTGAVVGAPIALAGSHPFALGSDGESLWVASIPDRTLRQLVD